MQALDAQINTVQQEQKAAVIAEMVARMREAGISPQDLMGKSSGKSTATKGKRVPVKYRNTATGDSWSGRGKQPNWLTAALAAGRKIEEFAV